LFAMLCYRMHLSPSTSERTEWITITLQKKNAPVKLLIQAKSS